MEFGKLDSLEGVDLALPPDDAMTSHTLGQLEGEHERRLYVGSTAWGQREFVGAVYPTGTKPGNFLRAYAKQFNTIELNTTFYRTPDHRQVLKWYADTPDDFRFCPKVNKAISQAGDLAVSNSRVLDFAKAVQHFEHKLGPCFIQLPPNFGADRFEVLETFLDHWPPSLRLAVELRHESWFGDSRGADAFAALAARGIGTVITDVAGRRDVAHMAVTAPFVLIRWVGNLDVSDTGRLEAWSKRLAAWFGAGLREVYMFTHQPEAVPSAESAADFLRFWRAQAKQTETSVKTRGPVLAKAEERSKPAQGNLF